MYSLGSLCQYEDCYTVASYNYPDETPLIYCAIHKLDNMINIKSKVCLSEWYNIQANTAKYNGYCCHCYVNLFPDDPISRNYKTKETIIKQRTAEYFADIDISITYDRQTGGCSKRRPDLVIDVFTHILIGEVDENQHKYYQSACERSRTYQLYEDYACRPVIFIRLNPDNYTDENYNKIPSCFKTNKVGKVVIADEVAIQTRLEVFWEKIKYYINNIPETSEFIYLYYDETPEAIANRINY